MDSLWIFMFLLDSDIPCRIHLVDRFGFASSCDITLNDTGFEIS